MTATTTTATKRMRLPFVGRASELARLTELHGKGRHVLILGPAGVGKSALVGEVRERLGLVVCERSGHLGEICAGLEAGLGVSPGGAKLVERKRSLLAGLRGRGLTVVFDGVGWTGPKVASLIEGVVERAAVWICARSEHPWDIGHVWPLLVRLERVELAAFHPAESQMAVAAAVAAGAAPPETVEIVDWLQRRSGGSPLVLRQLLEALAGGHYDVKCRASLRRLELDRRIHEVFPSEGTGHG